MTQSSAVGGIRHPDLLAVYCNDHLAASVGTGGKALPLGKPLRLVGVSHDITARRRTQSYQAALIALGDGIRQMTDPAAMSYLAAEIIGTTLGVVAQTLAPPAVAVPGPEVEYVYNVKVRRVYQFPNNDAIGYGFGICDKVTRGEPYAAVMGDVKRDVLPNDEGAANYLVSYAVGILCPAQIWALRNSAAGYQPPLG